MILVDTALKAREEAGDPVRVGLVGAGFMVQGLTNMIVNSTPGMRVVAIWPIAGLLVMTWWIGAYALIFGVMLVVLAFRLHRRHHPPAHAQAAGA